MAVTTLIDKDARPLLSLQSLLSLQPPQLVPDSLRMADPSGAAPQPGPNDISTAILRPKKSCVFYQLSYPYRSDVLCSPNRLIVDEATSDDNSGNHLFFSAGVFLVQMQS